MRDIRVGDVWYCEQDPPMIKYVTRVLRVLKYEFLGRDIIINVKDDFIDCGEVWHHRGTSNMNKLLYRGSEKVLIMGDHNMWCGVDVE